MKASQSTSDKTTSESDDKSDSADIPNFLASDSESDSGQKKNCFKNNPKQDLINKNIPTEILTENGQNIFQSIMKKQLSSEITLGRVENMCVEILSTIQQHVKKNQKSVNVSALNRKSDLKESSDSDRSKSSDNEAKAFYNLNTSDQVPKKIWVPKIL